ncbi:MAG: hypothetical protein KDB23_16010, partial [Planctomycetales bacterium]|nr:hypothetical protein [Planctomycetales bacterium]
MPNLDAPCGVCHITRRRGVGYNRVVIDIVPAGADGIRRALWRGMHTEPVWSQWACLLTLRRNEPIVTERDRTQSLSSEKAVL